MAQKYSGEMVLFLANTGLPLKNTDFIYDFMTKRAKTLGFFMKIYTAFL